MNSRVARRVADVVDPVLVDVLAHPLEEPLAIASPSKFRLFKRALRCASAALAESVNTALFEERRFMNESINCKFQSWITSQADVA